MALVLDTCSWIWFTSDPSRLSKAVSEEIQREKRRTGLVISTISLWEVAKLVQKGRLRFSIPCRDWIDRSMRVEGLTVYPLTPEICVDSAELPGDFHGDPADQIIVATARLLSAPIVTSDRKIRDYPHCTTIW